jgi:hypothetical protein
MIEQHVAPCQLNLMRLYYRFKWVNLGLTMDQRMSSLERHWAFFLGFGIPLTTLTFFLSSLRAAAVYAIFFPSVSSVLYSTHV